MERKFLLGIFEESTGMWGLPLVATRRGSRKVFFILSETLDSLAQFDDISFALFSMGMAINGETEFFPS
jgi:hypothetical protein